MKLPKEMKGRQKSIISFNRVMNGLEVYNELSGLEVMHFLLKTTFVLTLVVFYRNIV